MLALLNPTVYQPVAVDEIEIGREAERLLDANAPACIELTDQSLPLRIKFPMYHLWYGVPCTDLVHVWLAGGWRTSAQSNFAPVTLVEYEHSLYKKLLIYPISRIRGKEIPVDHELCDDALSARAVPRQFGT